MCVAIYSPMGTEVPSKKYLKNCWDTNPDGAGFAFNDKGRVRILKGFMTWKAFWETFDKFATKYDFTKRGVLMHFRIATHGGTNPECTHPFPLVADIGIMQKTDITTDYAVEHNGIISLTSSEASKPGVKASDTMKFIELYMSKIATNKEWFENPTNWELIYDLAVSKIACLNGAGEIRSTAGFTKADDGNYYSNTSYKDYDYYSKYYSRYMSYYDYGEDDDEYAQATKTQYLDEKLADSMFKDDYYGSDGDYDYFKYGYLKRSNGDYRSYKNATTDDEKKAAEAERVKVVTEYYPEFKIQYDKAVGNDDGDDAEDDTHPIIDDEEMCPPDCLEWGEIPALTDIAKGYEPVMLLGPEYACISATDNSEVYCWDDGFPMVVDKSGAMFFLDQGGKKLLDGNKVRASALYIDNVTVVAFNDLDMENPPVLTFKPNVQIPIKNMHIN